MLGVIAVITAMTASYLWLHGTTDRRPRLSRQTATVRGTRADDEVPVESTKDATADDSRKSALNAVDYKRMFTDARNYWELAHNLLPAAKAGNRDAQFYLSRVLQRCNDGNRMYFEHRGEKLTLDAGLQYAVQRHLPVELAQSVFDRCHEFQENDPTELGSAAEWLAAATDAGQPLARATTATQILLQEQMQNFARAGGVSDPGVTAPVGKSADPRGLLLAAVQSKDPEVLLSIGDAQNLLDPSNIDSNTTRYAWMLVACERGFDCTANAEWVKNSCAGDPRCASAADPSDLVRSLAGDKWPDLQQRAQAINAKLDASLWNELGLGEITGARYAHAGSLEITRPR